MIVNDISFNFLRFFFFAYLFLDRGEGREKERERNIVCCCEHPYWGPGLQPRHVP